MLRGADLPDDAFRVVLRRSAGVAERLEQLAAVLLHFAVAPSESREATYVSLYDGTVEGIAVPEARMFAVQYHPEDSPGPHDSRYLFRRFVQMIEG